MRIDLSTEHGLREMESKHQPNTPRTHDAHGRKVDDQVQCRKCFQTWPCDITILIRRLRSALKREFHEAH